MPTIDHRTIRLVVRREIEDDRSMAESDPLALADTWDLVAEGFDRSVWELFGQFGRRALELVDPPSDARVLDLACGAGSLTIPAAGRVAAVTAVDFSPRMVAATRRRIAAAGLANVAKCIGQTAKRCRCRTTASIPPSRYLV